MTDNPRLPIRKRLLHIAFGAALILQGLVIFSGSAQADTQRTRVAPFSETYYVNEEYTTTETYSIPLTRVTTTVDVYNYRTETYSIPLTPVTRTADVYNYRTETYSIPLTPVTRTVDVYNYRTETYSIPLTPVTRRTCAEWIEFWGAPACARWEETTTYVCQARGGCGPFERQVRIAPFTETTTTYVCQARGGCGPFERQVRIAPFTETTTTYVCQARGGCGPFERQVRIAPFTETTTTYVCQARGGCGPFTRQVTRTRQVAQTREVFNYADVPHDHSVEQPEDDPPPDDNNGNYNNNEETSDNSRDDGDPCAGTWAEDQCREVEERVGSENIPTMGDSSYKEDLNDLLTQIGDQPGFDVEDAEGKLNELIADDDAPITRDHMAEVLCAGLGISGSSCTPQELEDRGITVGTNDPPGGCRPEDRLDNGNCYDSTSTMSNDQLVTFISRTLGTIGNNGDTDIPQACPAGWTGTYPNCVAPPQACPAGWTGTYPNCQAPTVNPPADCPAGWAGTPPNCVPPQACPNGWSGTYPNCEAPPQISIEDVTVAEDAGSAVFTISLSKTWTSTVSVTVFTSDGTAEAGSDYTSLNTPATISAGSQSTSVSVPITDDSDDENNETFSITIVNPSNATLGTASATGTITDDDTSTSDQPDPLVTVSFASSTYRVTEPSSVDITIELDVDPQRSVVIPLVATPQGTTASSDYSIPANVTFNSGETSKTIRFTALDDTDQNNETVQISFGSLPSRVNGGSHTTVTINDDDTSGTPPPQVSISAATRSVAEDAGHAVFTISLSDPWSSNVCVAVDTSDGTATAGSDYTTTSQNVCIASTQRATSVRVPVLNDSNVEGDETFTVTISNPSSPATLGTASATVTITDDDTQSPFLS